MATKIMLKGYIKIQGVVGWTEVDANSLKNFEIERKTNYARIKGFDITFGKVGETNYRRVNESRILDAKFENDKVEIETKHNNDHINQIGRDYRQYWIARVKLTPTQKAENLTIFNFLFKFVMKRDPDENEKNEVIKLQTAFFKQNPNRIYPNPNVFMKILPKNIVNTRLNDVGFRFIESVIRADMEQGRYYKINNQNNG